MNPLLLILIEAGFNIGAAHAGSEVGNVIKTTGFLIDAARAIDELYEKEAGQPLDWSSLRHHKHLPPPGVESPDVPSSTGPEASEEDTAEGPLPDAPPGV